MTVFNGTANLAGAGAFAAAPAQLMAAYGAITRASVANYFDVNGDMQTAAINAARIGYDPVSLGLLGLLVEPATTNFTKNPRGVNAVVGTPGTIPTFWQQNLAGTTGSVVGFGTENNIPYVDLRWSGTSTGTSAQIVFDTLTGAIAAQGQVWTPSIFCKLQAGSFTNVTSMQLILSEATAGLAFLVNDLHTVPFPTGATLSSQRISWPFTVTNASTGTVRGILQINVTNAAAIDFTLRVGGAMTEQSPAATSLVLPGVGVVAASTRAADIAGFSGAGLLTAFAAKEKPGLATWAGASGLTAAGRVEKPALAALAGTGSLIANAIRQVNATAAMGGTGLLAVDASHTPGGAAVLAGAGLMAVDGSHTPQGAAALAGAGLMTGLPAMIALASAAMVGGSGFIWIPPPGLAFATSTMIGESSFSLSGGLIRRRSSIALHGAGKFLADAVLHKGPGGAFAGNSSFSANALVSRGFIDVAVSGDSATAHLGFVSPRYPANRVAIIRGGRAAVISGGRIAYAGGSAPGKPVRSHSMVERSAAFFTAVL